MCSCRPVTANAHSSGLVAAIEKRGRHRSLGLSDGFWGPPPESEPTGKHLEVTRDGAKGELSLSLLSGATVGGSMPLCSLWPLPNGAMSPGDHSFVEPSLAPGRAA